jgi:hypothetical protein
MVLPLLMSLGLPALAASGSIPFLTTLAGTVGTAGLAGLGAGLGSFIQTGDLGDGIKTGLASFLGGKVLGGITGGSGAANAPMTETAIGNLPTPRFLQAAPAASGAAAGTAGRGILGNLFSSPGMQQAAAGAFAPGVFQAGMIGQTMSDMSMAQRQASDAERKKKEKEEAGKPPMPRPMRATYNPDPFASGGGEGLYFQYQRPPAPPGYTPQYPYYYSGGGILSLRRMQEGGDVEVDVEDEMASNGMNEKDVIVEAIRAIKGASDRPEIVLGMFVQKYGEDALRDLVERVQSGELDDTVERFAEGEKGIVRGPGDGSGVDDMVPATLEGEQDVLLSDGEFVLRKKTADALEKAYGGGFLDIVNRSEDDAPRKLEAMVG